MMRGQKKHSIFIMMLLILLGMAGSRTILAQNDRNNDSNQQLLAQLNQIRQQQQVQMTQQGGTAGQNPAATATTTTTVQTTSAPNAVDLGPPNLQQQVVQQTTVTAPAPVPTRPYVSPRASFRAPFNSQQLPMTPEDRTIQDQAFAGAVRGLLPMSPEQIHRLRQLYTASQFAAAAPPGTPPKPTATSLFVNLSPGATPPVIRLAEGFVTSLVFLDATGAGWPIEAYDIGNPAAFNIQWNKTDNTLMVQASSLYTYGNLAVRLRGLGTPVMLTLLPGQAEVDYRVDVRIPENGPNAFPLPINNGLPPTESPLLLGVLNGIPPSGSKVLQIIGCGGDGQAWVLGDKIYLRTRLTLLSPGWLATMSSADGTHAYELQRTPMLLVAQNGKAVQVKIEGL